MTHLRILLNFQMPGLDTQLLAIGRSPSSSSTTCRQHLDVVVCPCCRKWRILRERRLRPKCARRRERACVSIKRMTPKRRSFGESKARYLERRSPKAETALGP